MTEVPGGAPASPVPGGPAAAPTNWTAIREMRIGDGRVAHLVERADPAGDSLAIDVSGSTVSMPIGRWLRLADLSLLLDEIDRQDRKRGPFTGSRLAEALDAWRDERFGERWDYTAEELLQVAAVAMRAIRDTLTNRGPGPEACVGPIGGGRSNTVGGLG